MDSSGLTRDTRVRQSDQAREGQEKANRSNVNSKDTKYRKEILNTTTVEQRR